MPGKMVGRASVPQEPGSPAISLLESSTSNQNKRSSSRASRRSTRFPDLHLSNTSSNPSRSSYSLPTTPIRSSFEDALPSTKRRRRRGSLSYESNKSINLSESKDLSSDLAKPFDTSKESNPNPDPHPDKLSTEAPATQSTDTQNRNPNQDSNPDKLSTEAQAPQPTDTQKSNRGRNPESDKASNEAQTTQSTLHSFLKKPQNRRKSLASQADLTDSYKSDSNTSTHESSVSGKRKTRKSMPAKMNGSANQDSKPQLTAASSRASTPQSTRSDRKAKSNAQSSANASTTSSVAKGGRDKPVTPAPSRGFTPINSSTRRTRKSVADQASQQAPDQPAASGDAMEIDSNSSVIESSVRGSSRANRRPMSNTITLNVGRKALESVLPAALDTTGSPYDHEIAESVEATPLHVYEESFGDGYHFDYTADMYGHNYGLDGQVDGPTSPTSLATSTSTGARTSGRARKPTIRAMESIESQRRFRRKRIRTPGGKEEPPANGDDVEMSDANAKPADVNAEEADAHPNKKRKKKQPTDAESNSPPIASAHPTPAPSAVAHSVASPSAPTYPASVHSASTPAPIHSAPVRPASAAPSPMPSAMAPLAPTPPAPANHTPAPYAPVPPAELSTERVDVVMRLISVTDDVLIAHPDAEEPDDAKFLEQMRNAFRQTHGLDSSENLPSSGNNHVEPLPREEKTDAELAAKAKTARARAAKAKSRKAKARRGKPIKRASKKQEPAEGPVAKVKEEPTGAPRELNEFGEEVMVVSTGYHWYRPNNTYGDGGLPQPPLRLKSDVQAERDRIFGFPPRMGERNLPRAFGAPFAVENIDEEKAKIRAREEARLRHIPVDRHMSTAEIRGLIDEYDSTGVPNPPSEKATRSSRKRRHVEGFGAPVESPQSRRRVGGGNSEAQVGPEPAAAITPSGPARTSLVLKMPRSDAHEAKKRPAEEASGQQGKANKRQKVHQEASGGEGQGQPTEPTRLTLSFKNKNKQQPKLKLRQPATPKPSDMREGVAEQAATPENPPLTSPGYGSSSRPRRRAAAALMAEFENHAQERARRANARKKRAEGTPEEAQ